jgi:capsular polysaccharide biosynthesis protein
VVTIVDISDSASRIGTFKSPSFVMSDATVIGMEFMTDAWRDQHKEISGRSFPDETLDAYMLEDAVVDAAGLIYDKDYRLIQQTIHQTETWEIDAYTYSIGEHARLDTIPYHRGTTVLCEKSGVGNYGHWLVEMLPVAFLFLPQLQARECFVRMPLSAARMNAVMFDSFSLLGVPSTQVRLRRPGPERYERLYVVPALSHHGYRYSPFAMDTLEAIAATIEAGEPAPIWVRRSDTNRRLVHEAAVCDELAARGWVIADTGKMRLHDQIKLFKGAKTIAGVAGAGLTNMAFAASGTPLTIFMPALMPDVFYWSLASFKQQPYREIRCPALEGTEGGNWNGLLDISVEDVIRLIT